MRVGLYLVALLTIGILLLADGVCVEPCLPFTCASSVVDTLREMDDEEEWRQAIVESMRSRARIRSIVMSVLGALIVAFAVLSLKETTALRRLAQLPDSKGGKGDVTDIG